MDFEFQRAVIVCVFDTKGRGTLGVHYTVRTLTLKRKFIISEALPPLRVVQERSYCVLISTDSSNPSVMNEPGRVPEPSAGGRKSAGRERAWVRAEIQCGEGDKCFRTLLKSSHWRPEQSKWTSFCCCVSHHFAFTPTRCQISLSESPERFSSSPPAKKTRHEGNFNWL